MVTWKRDFASGLIVLVPVIVTLWVVLWVFTWLAGAAPFLGEIDEELLAQFGLGFAADFIRVILTLVVFALIILGVGYLMRTAVGTVIENRLDQLMNRLPGLRVVYNASKMAAETTLTGTSSLQKPVKVEPWDGMRVTAFKTGKRTADGRQIIFMPTAPNITTGFVMEVDEDDIIEADERVEEALTRLLSAGFGDEDRGPAIGGLKETSVEDLPADDQSNQDKGDEQASGAD